MAPNASHASPAWETTLRPSSFTSLELATLAIALVVSSALLYVVAKAQERKRRRLPPGPRPWPVLGNLPVMASRLPHRALRKLSNQYGGVMFLSLGSSPCVVISNAAAVREMTRPSMDACFSDRPKGLFFALISGDYQTLVHAPHGPYWRQLRKFCSSQLFSPQSLASYQNVREQEIRNMMTVLEQKVDKGEAVDLKSWLFELSANNMTRMLISKRYFGSGGASPEERDEMHQVFLLILRAFMNPIIGEFIPSLSFVNKLLGTEKVLEKIYDDTMRIVGKMMELDKHREQAKERPADDDSYVPDFVDMISNAPLLDGTQPLTDRIQTLLISELLGAGTETASTTVEWAMSELVAHPDVMKQVQQELDVVVRRNGNGRLVQESDVPNLPFLCAVVKESFRLHPPGPLAGPRACIKDVEAWGYGIPANSRILLNVYAIHRDPELYTDPNEFIPERFMDRPEVNALAGFDSFELIPFGVGRRMCPGASLGYTMVHLMLGNLLLNYHWSTPKDTNMEQFQQGNLEEIFGITVCRKERLVLKATPRDAIVA